MGFIFLLPTSPGSSSTRSLGTKGDFDQGRASDCRYLRSVALYQKISGSIAFRIWLAYSARSVDFVKDDSVEQRRMARRKLVNELIPRGYLLGPLRQYCMASAAHSKHQSEPDLGSELLMLRLNSIS
jgi:hypothetical protein